VRRTRVLPTLEVKTAIQNTADPMRGYAAWQVGAGYVDAYGAVRTAFGGALR
jgi:serine protease AprX